MNKIPHKPKIDNISITNKASVILVIKTKILVIKIR